MVALNICSISFHSNTAQNDVEVEMAGVNGLSIRVLDFNVFLTFASEFFVDWIDLVTPASPLLAPPFRPVLDIEAHKPNPFLSSGTRAHTRRWGADGRIANLPGIDPSRRGGT